MLSFRAQKVGYRHLWERFAADADALALLLTERWWGSFFYIKNASCNSDYTNTALP